MVDFNVAPNKDIERNERRKTMEAKLKREATKAATKVTKGAKAKDTEGATNDGDDAVAHGDPEVLAAASTAATRKAYQWPDEDDGKDWFADDQSCQCSWDEIYYSSSKVVKKKYVESVTRFLLYRMPIPPGKRLLLDAGVLDGKWLTRPVLVQLVHSLGSHATIDEVSSASLNAPGSVKRRVEYASWHPESYWSYCEADDRMILHMYDVTVRLKQNCVVFSGDGDTTISMMNTRRERVRMLREEPSTKLSEGQEFPCVLHALPIHRWKAAPDGSRITWTDLQLIDTDRLALTVECFYAGATMKALLNMRASPSERVPRVPDGVAFFTALVCMHDTDYTRAYPQLSPLNILETFERQPSQAARWFESRVRRDPEILGAYTYLDCRIHRKAYTEYLAYATSVARERLARACRAPSAEVTLAPSSKKKEPTAQDEKMTIGYVACMAARMVWCIDKMVNAGLPSYAIPEPFDTDVKGQPLYGYTRNEKNEAMDANQIAQREWLCISRTELQ